MAKPTFNQRELLFESGVCKLLWRKNYFMLYRSLSFCATTQLCYCKVKAATDKWASEHTCIKKKNTHTHTHTHQKHNFIYKSKVQSILFLQAVYFQIPDLYDAKSELRLYIHSKFKHWLHRMQFVRRIVYYVLKLWWLDIQSWIVSL